MATAQCVGTVGVEAARYMQTLPPPSLSIRHLKLGDALCKHQARNYKYKVATAQCEGMLEVEAARYEQTLPASSLCIRHLKLLALKGLRQLHRYEHIEV